MPELNPQNPYSSYIVSASAGCGKTYQLSRRFLFLVGAGAEPSSILTVTFTKKAASEMKERILEDATELIKNDKASLEFNETMQTFKDYAQGHSEHLIEPPLDAKEVGKIILESSQRLRVSTIDSTYLDWYRKFPWEAKAEGEYLLPPMFEMATTQTNHELDEKAWDLTVKEMMGDEKALREIANITSKEPSLEALKTVIFKLQKHESFMWIAEKSSRSSPILAFPIEYPLPVDSRDAFIELKDSFESMKDYIGDKPREKLDSFMATEDLNMAGPMKIITAKFQLSGTTFRALKNKNPSLFSEVSEKIANYFLSKKLEKINQLGPLYKSIFGIYIGHRKRLKSELGIIDFTDPAKASFQIFTSPEASGATYLIHRNTQHLLLDEFQDTSYLQWEIFSRISEEIMAGEGFQSATSLKPSVFIVGDSKQSIYGFRMADSSIMNRASVELKDFGIKLANLNHSYRTSQSVLDWVNSTFESIIPDFPAHNTAAIGGKTVVPNLSTLCIAEVFKADEEKEKRSELIEKEANFVAAYIEKSVEGGDEPLTIFDKKTKKYRHLRPSDCAILYRNKANSEKYIDALLERGIESKREEGKGFFSRQEVRDHINLLKFLNTPSDSVSLGSVIKSPLSPIKDIDFLEALNNTKSDLQFERNMMILNILNESHEDWVSKINTLLKLAKNSDMSFVLQKAITLLGSYDAYKHYPNQTDKEIAEANISQLLEMVIEFEKMKSASFAEMIEQFDHLMDADETGSNATGSDAVTLMTIHKSKGLEYPFIIIVNSDETWVQDDKTWLRYIDNNAAGLFYLGNKSLDIEPPKTHPSFKFAQDQIKMESYQENTRLLYVAMTRSRHHLLVTGVGKKKNDDEEKTFFEHMLSGAEKMGFKEKVSCGHPSYIFEFNNEVKIEKSSEQKIIQKELFEDLVLTDSDPVFGLKTLSPAKLLQNKESLDASIKEQYPLAKEFGIFIHRCFEQELLNLPFDKKDYWNSLVDSIDISVRDKWFDIAEEHFEKSFKTLRDILKDNECLWVEQQVVHANKENELVRGTIDLLVKYQDGSYAIIDYKTTPEALYTENLLSLAKDHKYHKQLNAYKAAVTEILSIDKIDTYVYFTYKNELIKV